jgi:hypothetical protein
MGSWRPHGRILDAKDGVEWNVTIPEGLEFQEFYPYTASVTDTFYGDRIIGSTAGGYQRIGHEPISMWCVDVSPGNEGELIFNTEWLPPQPDLSIAYSGGSIEDGVFVLRAKETMQYWGFDMDTGQQIWGPTDPEDYMFIYGTTNAIAYGNFYSTYMPGIVYCYDINTGQRKWTYAAEDELGEMLWANNYPLRRAFVTDGKVFVYHGEHSPIDPKPRGGMLLCLDAESGDVIWEFDSMYFYYRSDVIIGDSIIAILDSYDQRFYGFGKGPSETTISIQNDVSTLGSQVLVTGTVMDVSPGTKDTALVARFPKGVPAVSDDSMTDWMKYVHQQFPRPSDASGVEVRIESVDPNGNYQNYGTTTTDSYGNFGFAFEPEVTGTYMIIATFEESDSYYSSTDTAYFTVEEASTPSTPIEPEEPTEPEEPVAPLISTEIAIILAVVVIAIVGVAAYWLLKRK